MNMDNFKDTLGRGFGRSSLYLQKHSPEILLGAGVFGMVATVVMASKATLKVDGVVTEYTATLGKITSAVQEGKTESGEEYSQQDAVEDTSKLYIQTGLKFAKLYGPAVGVGVLSIAAILGSHGVMAKRQVSLIAAYNLLGETYRQYRARVIEDLGEDVDSNYHLGLKDETRTETTLDEEGKKVKNKVTTKTSRDPNALSIYSRFFDEGNPMFRSDRLLNKAFLQSQQNYMNDILIIRGHLFLNEVYEALGFPHTKEGAIVGWVLKNSSQEMKEEKRDGHVDFGLYDVNNDPGREFINLTNPTVLLDFNVDGIIFDLI